MVVCNDWPPAMSPCQTNPMAISEGWVEKAGEISQKTVPPNELS